MYKMGRLSEPIRLELSAFDKLPKSPRKIFLCSTHELFGGWIPKDWRDKIFKRMKDFPQHTFQILTKMPENIDRPMPDNVHLGVTVTRGKDLWRVNDLYDSSAKIKFISLEPLLSDIEVSTKYAAFEKIDWVIIGRLTGYGKKYDPDISWIKDIIQLCADLGVKVFLKENLKSIWGDKLIQEFPDAKV